MKHKCLSCSGQITEGQEEERVPENKGAVVRYRHVNYEDCQAELSGPSELGSALHAERIRQRRGHVANLPGLGTMEDWE